MNASRGRRPLPDDERREYQPSCRMTGEEVELIDHAAELCEERRTQWMRRILLEELSGIRKPDLGGLDVLPE